MRVTRPVTKINQYPGTEAQKIRLSSQSGSGNIIEQLLGIGEEAVLTRINVKAQVPDASSGAEPAIDPGEDSLFPDPKTETFLQTREIIICTVSKNLTSVIKESSTSCTIFNWVRFTREAGSFSFGRISLRARRFN